jgi:ABC-type nitrate/sulfonate/bicarbonate transport system substrate-binding protein
MSEINASTNRRAFLKTAGLAGIGLAGAPTLLSACASPPSTSTATSSGGSPLTMSFAFLENVEYGGYFIADDKGYYGKQGINPTFQGGGGNGPAPELELQSGSSQLATEANMVRLFQYLAQHDDITLIAAQFQSTPNGLLSLAKRPVTDKAQLNGATILAAATNRPDIAALMKINGITDYKFSPAGADVGPLLAGQGDALLAFATNQPITLQQQFHMKPGRDYYFTLFSDLSYYVYSDVVIVSRAYLDKNRDEVVRFMKATIQGWQDYLSDPSLGAELAVTKYGASLGLNLAQQTAAAQAQVPLLQSPTTKAKGLFRLDLDYMENKMYPSLRAGGITKLPPVSAVTDTTVLDDVFMGKARV